MNNEPLIVFDDARGVLHADVARPAHASFSSLDQWMTCPGRWVASRLIPPDKPWGSPLVLGSLCHAALELAMRDPKARPDWTALCREGVVLERERNRERGFTDDPAPAVPMPDGRMATVDDWVRAAAAKLGSATPRSLLDRTPVPARMEQMLSATVWGIPFTGAVDYRDETGFVADWKTGRVPQGLGARRHADQLRVYRMMLAARDARENGRPVKPVRVREAFDVYVEHGVRVGADLSKDACADTGVRLRAAWDGMLSGVKSGEYALTPSGLCGWCPLARVCPRARVVGAKAREASLNALAPDDARVAHSGTHMGGGKETNMAFDLLGMMGAAPAPEPEPAPKPEPERHEDPWDTERGRAALAAWGLGEPASKPEPKTEPKPEPEAKTLRARTGRPFEATLGEDGAVNLSGYGFTQLALTVGHARRLAGEHAEWTRPLAVALLAASWRAAHKAFGPAAPAIPGLDDGTPQPGALLAWLDSTLARDADRVLRDQLDADPLMQPGRTDTLDGLETRIREAGVHAAEALSAVRAMLG